jgi:cobalt-zinc-cadmium efflux system membrane fusion protein
MKTKAFSLLAPLSLFASQWPAEAGEPFDLPVEAIANLKLEFAPVEPRPISRELRATGSVRLDESKVIDVVPRIAGLVTQDHRTLGAIVSKGDKLFTIESADLSEWITAYVDAEQAMTFAQTALDQEKALFAKNLSSKENLRARELDFQKAVAGHTRALQPLKLLHFDEGSIHQYLDEAGGGSYTTLDIAAPEAGEVIEKSVRRGAAVEPDETLYTIADLDRLWVDFHVSLRDAASLATGQTVVIESSVNRGERRDAEIVYVAPIAGEATRTVLARAKLPNKDRAWRPGTPISALARIAAIENAALTVPAAAMVDFEGAKAVFVRESDTTFRAVTVQPGESDGKVTQILRGLSAGQTVVGANAAQLKGHLEMTRE